MYCRINTYTLRGLAAVPVTVETDISDGMPVMELVGYLGSEVKEAKERVRTALKNSGILLPPRRITINISPAGIRKQGTAFDLPIALALLVCMGIVPEESLQGCCIMGELGLDGSVRAVGGALPRVLAAAEAGMACSIIPADNLAETMLVSGMRLIPATSLSALLLHLSGEKIIEPVIGSLENASGGVYSGEDLDFADISGQVVMKRGLEIAASGLHNVLLIGPPGSGKTMAARRMPTIMPPMTEQEIMELTKIYSVAGCLPAGEIVSSRPFVSPHHSCTPQALVGGGVIPKPGAVTLAHNSVLFLDELPEFRRECIEMLRQPLEDREVRVTRAASSVIYPADFLFVGAMNPCRCGYYPGPKCRCTESEVRKYTSRISGPILDRIDLAVGVENVGIKGVFGGEKGETSAEIRSRVAAARERQHFRFRDEEYECNGRIKPSHIEKYCALSRESQRLLENAFEKLGMTARTCHRVLRTARTIADLEESEEILERHLMEAISFRISEL